MKLVIGLGNPEDKYLRTRHNVGWRMLDIYADKQGADWQNKSKFKALVAEVPVEGEKVILAKPTTYYNLSGEASRAIADFYKIAPQDVLVVHDELALPFGTIRTRLGGSDAGNNGVKSISQHLGENTARVRIGVYNDLRDRIDDRDFVLNNFTRLEAEKMPEIAEKVGNIVDDFVLDNFQPTTHS